MKFSLHNTLLGIPLAIWVLQILYVALALLILFVLYTKTDKKINIATYVIVIITIDIIWRLAIKNKF